MNSKISIALITLCAIIIIPLCILPVLGDLIKQFNAISTPLAFTSSSQFQIPITNSTINFAQDGYYLDANLLNDTWVFGNLQLNQPNEGLLADSPNTINLNITTNTNLTITSFERLLTPDCADINNTGSWLTPGWLNYSVADIGTQVIMFKVNLANWTEPSPDTYVGIVTWPIGLHVFIDGKEAPFNINWTYVDDSNGIIPYGAGVIVNGGSSNVSIEYAWVPVPIPANGSPANSNLEATKASPEIPLLPYLLVAITSGVIIPVALLINRHRLASIITKRIKRTRDSAEAINK